MDEMSRNFQRAAENLLARMALPSGSVTLQETRRDNQPKIIANIESGARPKETPQQIEGYSVVYQTRKVIKIQ